MLELNPEQRQAVEHGEGPLLVIAGPGSGKTRVITERMVHLLRTVPRLEPENILAVTFTNKAAQEMKGRVNKALGNPPRLPHISTFHSFCTQVLQGRHSERRLLDKVDVWIFLRQRLAELGLDFYQKLAEPGAFLHGLNEFFGRCQDELIEPADFEAYVEDVERRFLSRRAPLDSAEKELLVQKLEREKELARVFRNSQRLLAEAGCSSLGSLISEAVRLWDREPELLANARSRFRYVLVDEFQDTNYVQVELLKRLAPSPANITAVGDDDQAIYRFRGAAHGAFEMFKRAFPGAKTVFLNHNFRSTKKILRSADLVISKNQRFERKPLLTTRNPEGSSVYLLESPDYQSEAAWIAEEVERLVKGQRLRGEIAVLYRGHNHRDLLVDEFRRREIPFAIQGLTILRTPIVRDVLAYLSLAHSPHDNISLTRVLLAPRWGFPEQVALEIRDLASCRRCSLFEALETKGRVLLGSGLEQTGWPELKKVLRGLHQAADNLSVTNLFELLTERLGLRFLDDDPEQATLALFEKFLGDWEKDKSQTGKLREFIEYFQYFVEAGGKIEGPEPEDRSNAVQMMTVHAAKGLEFPVVFILGVARQRFPHREEKPVIEFPDALRKGPEPPPNVQLEEERRLFYVAMTRSRERLYISSVSGSGRYPSQFVDDLLSDPVVRARDVERIRAPRIAVGPVPDESGQVSEPPPRTRERTDLGRDQKEQLSLFRNAGSLTETFHPDLEEWVRRAAGAPPSQKLQLSATSIDAYRECPLKYKFTHTLKIPTGPQAALTFGNIMHQCVRRYFELRRKTLPRCEELREFYLSAWKDVGFEDSYQEQAYKESGIEQLQAFVETHNAKAVSTVGAKFEERFTLDLGDLVLEGRIDQINPLEPSRSDGLPGDGAVELIDYKTGRPRSQKEADRSLQLSVYALAAKRQLKLNPIRLTLYYLTTNQTVSTVRTDQDLNRALEEIREVAEKIRGLVFEASPGYVCKWCDFVPVCPVHEERF
jgi:DNA helicase-2/ATP-dependent DNA helicase PcrA